MIVWIDRRLALAIHERQLAEHGGGSGVRDESLLESALARPQQLFAYGDPPPYLAALRFVLLGYAGVVTVAHTIAFVALGAHSTRDARGPEYA